MVDKILIKTTDNFKFKNSISVSNPCI